MRGNGAKLHWGRFRLGIRKKFFATRVLKHWDRIPREVADALCLSVFKKHLANALHNVLYLLVSPEGVMRLGSMLSVGPFQLFNSVCSEPLI